MHWLQTVLRGDGLLPVAVGVAMAMTGCAAGEVEPVGAGGEGASDASGAGGIGGAGGAGGIGGEGTGPCATDCSTITPPTCHVALCNDGSYPGPVGQCVVVPDVDGAACDDGLFCTTDDTCQAGSCVGGPQNDCGMDPAQCEAIACDESAKSCAPVALDNGTPCMSDDLCLAGSTCSNGLCSGGTPKDCFFAPVPNDCHVAVCNPLTGDCEPIPGNEGEACTDTSDLCTIDKTCAAGACVGGEPKDCSNLTEGCDLGVCDDATGQCTTEAVMDGQICDDLDACTTGEICNLGSCGGGAPVTVCSQTADGCCPAACTALDDIDCACQIGSLATPFNSNNGSAGNMFDIAAVKNIEVQGFEVNISSGTKTIEVYYRAGSYVGHENSSAGWTLAGSASAVSNGQDVATPVPLALSIQVPAGQTYGFYVTVTTSGMRYTNGTAVGTLLASNQDLEIFEGVGKGYPFGATNTTRNFNGIVHYKACGE